MLFPLKESSAPPRAVVVTGAGIITALGCGWETNANGFRAGRRCFQRVSLFDVSRHRVKVAAQAELPPEIPYGKLGSREARRLDRAAKLLLVAAKEAWVQAGNEGLTELPIVLGTTSGGMSLGQDYYRQAIEQPLKASGQASRVLHYLAQSQAIALAGALNVCGPLTIIANACASGANAIGHAADLIRCGSAEAVLTGGYDALSELVFTGFDCLQALSPGTCRPFDARRDGLALGEGAAVFVLESKERALRRNAVILGEIAGYGATTDRHHLTQPQPEGEAALRSMKEACEEAGIAPGQINYINAHGTGTPLNDSAEAAAINRWAGGQAECIPVSSTKALIGHLLGAAGAVETAVCLMALQGQWLPPMPVETPDPVCRFPLVGEPAAGRLEFVLTNSFGFGGANASLVLKRAE